MRELDLLWYILGPGVLLAQGQGVGALLIVVLPLSS